MINQTIFWPHLPRNINFGSFSFEKYLCFVQNTTMPQTHEGFLANIKNNQGKLIPILLFSLYSMLINPVSEGEKAPELSDDGGVTRLRERRKIKSVQEARRCPAVSTLQLNDGISHLGVRKRGHCQGWLHVSTIYATDISAYIGLFAGDDLVRRSGC